VKKKSKKSKIVKKKSKIVKKKSKIKVETKKKVSMALIMMQSANTRVIALNVVERKQTMRIKELLT
jgi:hypothetical protein